MCSVPSATVAVNDGAAAATGAAAIEVTRAASATPPSNGFLVMSLLLPSLPLRVCGRK